MYVVTNREVRSRKNGIEAFGSGFNRKGPRELRLLDVQPADPSGDEWNVELLGDTLSRSEKAELGALQQARVEVFAARVLEALEDGAAQSQAAASGDAAKLAKARALLERSVALFKPEVHAGTRAAIPRSELVIERMFERLAAGRDFVFFVHGYNTDVRGALARAHHISAGYDVEVVVMSWPSRGGGGLEKVAGTASYLRDKEVAQLSAPALSRCLARIGGVIAQYRRGASGMVAAVAEVLAPEPSEARRAIEVELERRACPVKLTMLAHSMGNYLLKKMLQSSTLGREWQVFDNCLLVAADTNDAGHAQWVEQIRARNRVFIVTNEDDFALAASKLKWGEEQRARLGHVARRRAAEMAPNAIYVDFTDAEGIGRTHTPFDLGIGNEAVRAFFASALTGGAAERTLKFDVGSGTYRVP